MQRLAALWQATGGASFWSSPESRPQREQTPGITSGVMQLTSLDFRPVRAFPAWVAGMLVALPAHASEGLVLMPDLFVTGVLLVAFVVIIFPLNRLIFQPLQRVMDEREDRIDGARRRADSVEQQAEEALARYEESIRTAYDDATAERRRQIVAAREELARVTGQAKTEAEQEAARARESLSASVSQARDSLREGAAELANLAAERILGRGLNE